MAFKKYFAAANTPDGFLSYFPDIFSPDKLKRLYIIKGGPGTGKSTMIKFIADEAAAKGYDTELYYCSSDTRSLDGVLIPELSAAVIDGTAPHTTDPKYPGAVDVILDFGAYFDRKKLSEQRAEIIRLSREYSEQYRKAASYFSYAASAAREAFGIYASCADLEKLKKTAKKLTEGMKRDGKEAKIRQITAFSTQGSVRLDTYEKSSSRRIAICGDYGEGTLLTELICSELNEKGVGCEYNVMNIMPERRDAVYVPSAKTLFELVPRPDKREKQKYAKIINTERFIDKKRLSPSKGRLRMLKKIKTSLCAEASAYLKTAGKLHDELEQIYKNAVDFDGVRELMKKTAKEIFEN